MFIIMISTITDAPLHYPEDHRASFFFYMKGGNTKGCRSTESVTVVKMESPAEQMNSSFRGHTGGGGSAM